MTSIHNLRTFVSAHVVTGVGVVIMWCHQMPLVFSCPTRRALVCSRYHYLWASCSNITRSTWCVMLVKVLKVLKCWGLIFGAIDCCCVLPTINKLIINGIVGETNVVGTTTGMSIIAAAHKSFCTSQRRLINLLKLTVCWNKKFGLLIKSIPVTAQED